jgi:homoserine kinase
VSLPRRSDAQQRERFSLRVPGSIANLGPGFDTLAVAIELYLQLDVIRLPGEGELRFRFLDCRVDGENYIERAFRFLGGQCGGSHPSLEIGVRSDIPIRGGLGSSAAATVAGLRLYEAVSEPLAEQGLLNAACALEGHPDNVAAALLGGLTVSCQLPDRSAFARRLEWPPSLSFIVLTPQLPLATSASRNALPSHVSHDDAVFNLQRVALFLQAIQSGDYSLLREALHDRLHQPFRKGLVPGLDDMLALQHPDLLGVCLSGAGPSIVALADRNLDGIELLLRDAFAPQNIPFVIRRLAAHSGNPPAEIHARVEASTLARFPNSHS